MHTEKRTLLIVAPYQDEKAFLDTMQIKLNADLDFLNYKTNLAVSRSVLQRHLVIFRMAYKAFRKSKEKDFIFFGEQFVGLYYAFFSRIFFWQKTSAQALVLQLIYNKKNGLAGKIYASIYKWLINSPSLKNLICHASLEREYYRAEFGEDIGNKIYFVPFGRSAALESNTSPQPAPDNFFFSGGTSNRDYKTLIEAFKGLNVKLIIACHANDVKGLTIPTNVTVRHDVFGPAFQEYIDRSYAVILPIISTDVSAGQLVLIDAMRSGKASIVTAGSCMEDYVDSSCAMGVPKRDVAAMKAAVVQLASSQEMAAQLGVSARARYEREFTRSAFADRLSNIMLGHSNALT